MHFYVLGNGMKKLDNTARIVVEKNIDSMINTPKETEETYRFIIGDQGIEPNLETILSFVTGMLMGVVDGFYYSKYKRLMDNDERNELLELLKRRAFELRQAFISTRIET